MHQHATTSHALIQGLGWSLQQAWSSLYAHLVRSQPNQKHSASLLQVTGTCLTLCSFPRRCLLVTHSYRQRAHCTGVRMLLISG